MISIRRARPADAQAIGEIHAAVWRSAYAGILPDAYLAGLSPQRLGGFYQRALLDRREGHAVFVAVAGGTVVGFGSCGRSRRAGIAEGEVETLYLLEDWRERGAGRRLMRAMGAHLRAVGCRSAMLWVLHDNPTRWFYRHLGGREVARDETRVGGQPVAQAAYTWDPIETLLAATAPVQDR
ncbi:GNAT family N-acetyltransferase [Roseomonas terrae]|uniref:GNAT family N-acetyltransferase n=1 Tax=Neoroseomonas terrae TaxID=424799 RepID=A0ABS5ENY2_9PROT|nr:GNAT family N-acetyltransferase [Neoroseomonas terrae]